MTYWVFYRYSYILLIIKWLTEYSTPTSIYLSQKLVCSDIDSHILGTFSVDLGLMCSASFTYWKSCISTTLYPMLYSYLCFPSIPVYSRLPSSLFVPIYPFPIPLRHLLSSTQFPSFTTCPPWLLRVPSFDDVNFLVEGTLWKHPDGIIVEWSPCIGRSLQSVSALIPWRNTQKVVLTKLLLSSSYCYQYH